MGLPDSLLLDLLEKVRSWFFWGSSDPSSLSVKMSVNIVKMCCECRAKIIQFSDEYHCQNCDRWYCAKCIWGYELDVAKMFESGDSFRFCKSCDEVLLEHEDKRKSSKKVHPCRSPTGSSQPPSPCFNGGKINCSTSSNFIQSDPFTCYPEAHDLGYSPHVGVATQKSMISSTCHPSPLNTNSPSRSEGEVENCMKHYFRHSSEYCHDISDVDSSSASASYEVYYKSVGSSPSDSPSSSNFGSHRVSNSAQSGNEGSPMLTCQSKTPFDGERMAISMKSDNPECTIDNSYNSSIFLHPSQKSQKGLAFENNDLIWFPPPPDDKNSDIDSNFFSYDDDDDDIGHSGAMFSSSSSLSSVLPGKEKQNQGSKEPLRAVVQGHFRSLVSHLLHGEGIKNSQEEGTDCWLDILTTIAWQAANYVKPDTTRGGSMDPGDYVKVKCIASGNRSDSALVRGVVCTKKIKHKRMVSQYKNPKLLLLGGALECQSLSNQLASFNTLVQQEKDHLKVIMSKIEALRPNVLLVEKTVSPCAQAYLLEKEISLVPNVKKPLLERIARCTGALVCPSIDSISTTRLGHCELFHLEKVSGEHEHSNQFSKNPSKTLMFFEGCPRRLGCTVLLRGDCCEELKKLKHVIHFAIFAAYHLSLETSFLADEGATLPRMALQNSISIPEKKTIDKGTGNGGPELLSEPLDLNSVNLESADASVACTKGDVIFGTHGVELEFDMALNSCSFNQIKGLNGGSYPSHIRSLCQPDLQETMTQEMQTEEIPLGSNRNEEGEVPSDFFAPSDNNQSILVYFSNRCILKGNECERSRLLRIKFYGRFDKQLGKYLHDDLFSQTSCCGSCNEPVEAHVLCYTHQQGNLTINVRRLSSIKLPGEHDGKIWMWHRCLKCARINGVPPATRRVVMSDSAWGLSFGKFLELSFSNHATANRVAPCGHSLQRDCLRYYGSGSMVAFFRYSSIEILSVLLPPPVLGFDHIHQEWTRKEAKVLVHKVETFYSELSCILNVMEHRSRSSRNAFSCTTEIQNHIMELKERITKEKSDFHGLGQSAAVDLLQLDKTTVDILEINRLTRQLLDSSRVWDHRLYTLDSLLQTNSVTQLKVCDPPFKDEKLNYGNEDNISRSREFYLSHEIVEPVKEPSLGSSETSVLEEVMFPTSEIQRYGETASGNRLLENALSDASILSEQIDSAWTGTEFSTKPKTVNHAEETHVSPVKTLNKDDNPSLKKLMSPMRVQSFDSALTVRELIHEGVTHNHASRDLASSVMRSHSQKLPFQAKNLNLSLSSSSYFVTSRLNMISEARLLLPNRSNTDIVVAVYDNDPASIISYALSTKEYDDWVFDNLNECYGKWNVNESINADSATSVFSAWQSFGSLDTDSIRYGSYSCDDISPVGIPFVDSKKSQHLIISFADESIIGRDKVKFSVTCYFAKQFDSLRKKYCPNDVDFIRSLSRCERWSAEGGKSNVYFARSMDERFIVKQVKKTELDSFEEFAPEYFKYLMNSLGSGSPTCLAKILGIYQVTVKNLKGGKDTKMDLMVMENIFYRRNVSRVYDLKGSARSRYIPDATGTNKVLLDMNLVEALRTEPIFLGGKAKRTLERAIWNDTSFLASVDVMDYSLLVGVDEERNELVLGIIDFMRQYTWDKHLETWVKAIGGPKNASPTIISPKQYKKRFRKAMTSYFLTLPEQWSS